MKTQTCLCMRLRRATRAVTRLYDQALEPAGVNITQYSQLRNISRLDEPTIGTLAREIALDRSTTGRNVRVLLRMGLVTLGPGEDERTRQIRLTARGRAVIGLGAGLWEGVQTELEDVLGDERHNQLLALLDGLEMLAEQAPLNAQEK